MQSSATSALMLQDDNALQHDNFDTVAAASQPISDRHPRPYLKDHVVVVVIHSSTSSVNPTMQVSRWLGAMREQLDAQK
ncbi:hypothetical protein ACOSP7_015781 [Xanthoceras sorbifolium]